MSGTQLGLMGGGIPRPTGLLNGASALPLLLANTIWGACASGYINAKSVLTGALTANTLSTILNLSGAGAISFLACSPVDTTSRTHRFKITLDGAVIFDGTSAASVSLSQYCPVIGGVLPLSPSDYIFTALPEVLMFNTSLLVEYASSNSETAKTAIAYKYYPR